MRRAGAALALMLAGLAACPPALARAPDPPAKASAAWAKPCQADYAAMDPNVHYVPARRPCVVQAPHSRLVLIPVQRQAMRLLNDGGAEDRLWRPLAGDLIVILATHAEQFEYPRRADIAGGGALSDDALIAIARANADRWAAHADVGPDPEYADRGPVLKVTSGDLYPVALALSPKFWARPEFKAFKGPPVLVLDDEAFWVADGGDPGGLAALAGIRDWTCQASQSIFVQSCSLAGYVFTPDGKGGLAVWRGPMPPRGSAAVSAASIGLPEEDLLPTRADLTWFDRCRPGTAWTGPRHLARPSRRCMGRAPGNQTYLLPVSAAVAAKWGPSDGTPGARVWRPLAGDLAVVVGAEMLGAPPRSQIEGGDSLADADLLLRARHSLDRAAGNARIQHTGQGWFVYSVDLPASSLALSGALWTRKEFAGFSGPPVIEFSVLGESFSVIDGGDPAAVTWLAGFPGGACSAAELHRLAACSDQRLLFTPAADGGLRVWGRRVGNRIETLP